MPSYTCGECQREFSSQGWLDWHMKKYHARALERGVSSGPRSSFNNLKPGPGETPRARVRAGETETERNYRIYQEPLALLGYPNCPTCGIYYHSTRSASHPKSGVCLNVL